MQEKITQFWNNKPCGSQTSVAESPLDYFRETEAYRYKMMPFICDFAEFYKYRGKRILEIGIGIGCDFNEFVKQGALAYGIDASSESVEMARRRLRAYKAEAVDLSIANAEQLPYKNNMFDAVYSFGCLHHVPNTRKAIHEAIRVCKVDGKIKLMLYNRSSIYAYLFWTYNNLRGNFPKSLEQSFWDDFESIGTKAFTENEVLAMLPNNVVVERMWCPLSGYDFMLDRSWYWQMLIKVIYDIVGSNTGFYRLIALRKTQ